MRFWMVFLARMASTGCREAPPARRTRWVFCWGYLSLSWAAARERSPLKSRAPRLRAIQLFC